MKFAAIGSVASIQLLEQCEGYVGGVCLDDNDSGALLKLLPAIEVVLFELSPAYLNFVETYLPNLQNKPVVYFENVDSTIQINGPLAITFQDIMSNYYKVHTQTQGQIGYLDAAAITLNSLNHLRTSKLEQVMALEVGSWTGCSTFFLAKAINSRTSQDGTLYCLDTWRGNEYWNYDIAAYIDIFASFRGYMTCYGVYRNIIPVVADSAKGFPMMRDDFFDIIFIDGDHRYAGASSDIANAIQKIKPGGLLMGHDCSGYADDLPADFLFANLDKDCAFFAGKQYSCGVLKALKDFFGRDYHTLNGGSVWYKVITPEDKTIKHTD